MADFNPVLKGYSGQTPFRFWCQTVMPLVYDESLSYYELLCKIMKYLNNTIQDVANTEDNVAELAKAYSELQDFVNNYFDTTDFQQMVEDKIDELVQTGVMDNLVNQAVASLINQTVAGQIDSVVAGQIGDVVEGQIDSAVADQLPGVVEQQIGEVSVEAVKEVTEQWLQDNITEPPIDKTLSIEGAASDSAIVGGLVLGDNPLQPIAFNDSVKYSAPNSYEFSDYNEGKSGYGFTEFKAISATGGVGVKILKVPFDKVVIASGRSKRFKVYVDLADGAQIAPTIRVGFTNNISTAGVYDEKVCDSKGIYEFVVSNTSAYREFSWVYVSADYASDLNGVYVYNIDGMIGAIGANGVTRSGEDGTDVVVNDVEGGAIANGGYSTSEGFGTQATGKRSHAEGYQSIASGSTSHAEGYGTVASASYSHSEGFRTVASGLYSHAEGGSETDSGGGVVKTQVASGRNSHAEGRGCEASGDCAHVEGNVCTASGEHSHAEGEECQSVGKDSHAEGAKCTSYGEFSHAGGHECYVSGVAGFVHGIGLNSYTDGQAVVGEYNNDDSNAEFIVGVGSNVNNVVTRRNGFSVMKNGNIKIGNTELSEQQLQDLLALLQ